jgi:hypothetical protein
MINTIYNFINSHLPIGYNFGDDGQIISNNIPDHMCAQQAIREDHEGDVGIFELGTRKESLFHAYTCDVTSIQIPVVTINGDIDIAKKYLNELFKNIKGIKNEDNISILECNFINLLPLGKNSKGLQMVELTIQLKYIINN